MLATYERLHLGHPALEGAIKELGAIAGLPMRRAADVLSFLLRGINQSTWGEVAWCSSSLTSSGFPVELAFASHGHELRYTSEIAGPEVPAHQRLSRALDLMAQLDRPCAAQVPGWLLEQQKSANLTYGAWISGRHTLQSDRYKLYAEVGCDESPTVRAMIRAWLGQEHLLSERKSTLRMIGFEPSTGRTELYFRTQHLELHHLYPLMALAGCRQQASLLVDFIQQTRRWSDPYRLPGRMTGVSYTFAPNAPHPVCTIFLPAGQLWGSDVEIRQQVMHLIDMYGWQMEDYLALSAKLPLGKVGGHRHGLVGVSVVQEGKVGMGIGVSVG